MGETSFFNIFCLAFVLVFGVCFANVVNRDCRAGERFNRNFFECCDDVDCHPGNYFNCTKCIPCPIKTFMEKASREINCSPHKVCQLPEVNVAPGNSTHDVTCALPATGTTTAESTDPMIIVTVTNRFPSDEGWTPLQIGLVVAVPLLVVVLAVVAICFVLKKKIRWPLSTKKEGCGEEDPMVLNLDADGSSSRTPIETTKADILSNFELLRDKMDSTSEKFWMALKEGKKSEFSYDLQKEFATKGTSARNKTILNIALKNRHNLRSLVYALAITRQDSRVEAVIDKDKKAMDTEARTWISSKDYLEGIIENRVYVFYKLQVIPGIWCYLRKNNVFTREDEDKCDKMSVDAIKDYLIEEILRGDPEKFKNFLEALEGTSQKELLGCLTRGPSNGSRLEGGDRGAAIAQEEYANLKGSKSCVGRGGQIRV